jgi:CheY-like chemotaxis protein
MYRVTCQTCGVPYDATKAADCSCLTSHGTFTCPNCGKCFCSAGSDYQERFWIDAPEVLWKRRRRRALASVAEETGEIDPTKPIVLFADDDPTGRRIAQKVINDLGCAVITAKDGEQLLERARQIRPELVITDALMPRRDGRETAKIIKQEMPATKIVIVTSVYRDPRYKHEALRDFGVDEYLTKPVSPETLATVVRRLLPGVSK